MKQKDIKRLEKARDLYGKIAELLDKTEYSLDFEDKFMLDVVRQMSASARADRSFLEGKIKSLNEDWGNGKQGV